MSPVALLADAEADLRLAAQRYTQAQTRGDFLEAMLGFQAGLEKAFDAVLQLTPEDEDVPFARKAESVLPEYSQELRRLNSVRNELSHDPRMVSEQKLLAASAEFAQITVRAWGQLFDSVPPSLSRSRPGSAAPASSQSLAASPAQSKPAAETKTKRFRWWNLLAFLVLIAVTPLLAGFAFQLGGSGIIPDFVLIAVLIIAFVLACVAAYNAWRFVRAFGVLRLLGAVVGLIVIAGLILIPFSQSTSGLAGRADVAFGRVLVVASGLTIDLVPTQFANGQDLAARVIDLARGTGSLDSVPLSATPEFRATSVVTPSSRESESVPTLAPALSPPVRQPTVLAGSIGIGALVVVQTDGGALLGRVNPGRSSEVVVRFPNGAQLTVLDGPQDADGLTWWQVEGEAGSGWSADDFLRLADE